MMDNPGLLDAVLAQPQNDAPRLVYANWLEEHGQSDRAAFIRLQCEVAAEGLFSHDEKSWRAKRLLFDHWEEWTASLADLGMMTRIHFMPDDSYEHFVGFHRGFVTDLCLTAEHFVLLAEKFFAAAPLVSSVTLRNTLGALWRRAEGFDPKDGLQDPAPLMRRLKHLPQRGVLSHLDLSTFGLTPEAFEYLCGCPLLSQLTHISLWGNELGNKGARLLSDPYWWHLEEINLDTNGIGDDGANALADYSGLPQIVRLTLTGNDISEAGIKRLRLRYGESVEV